MNTLNDKQLKKVYKSDLIASLTLFIMLIPQGMAYAMLAGLPPIMGLYASTIPLIIYAFFASSRHLSVGPVAITSLLVFSGVSVYANPGSSEYISTTILLTLMVGVIQLILGICKAGAIVKFIPSSVISGYTSAAALVIGISQLKHLLGINIGNHLQLHLILIDVIRSIPDLHLITILIGATSIVGLIVMKRVNRRIPAALFIMLFIILIVFLLRLDLRGLQIVGDVPKGFPLFSFPTITVERLQMLFPIAITIALLGFMESLAISKKIAKKENYPIYPNRELKALGLSNMIGSFFQSFPVNGSFSRTAVNHETGGKTQLVSIMTASFVMMTILFFTSFFYYLPNAVLAAIIIVSVYKLIDFYEMKHLFEVKPLEGWIWIITFIVTIFVGIQWGIIMGAFFALLLLIRRAAKPNIVEIGYLEKDKAFRDISRFPMAHTSNEVTILRIDSSIHFANIAFLEEKIKNVVQEKASTKFLIIDMSGVNDIDTISIESLETLIDYYKQEKDLVILFAHMKGSIRDMVNKVGWNQKYLEQMNHLTIEQLLKEKGLYHHYDFSKKVAAGGIEYYI